MKLATVITVITSLGSTAYARDADVGYLYCGHVLLRYDRAQYEPKIKAALETASILFSYHIMEDSLFLVGAKSTGMVTYSDTCSPGKCFWARGKPKDYCTGLKEDQGSRCQGTCVPCVPPATISEL
ncbi:hypothetical protein FE257_000361 [Aspergillus nanangensis]|uniref:Uncharacterized protein n=1 Tax=Aspergillus nanangensis TaxID=2582783 RepID=A0AAD4CW19_ASPNN|nr:hypothetical protein FE257_000361 [Aspergillus nanangensis]